MVGDGRSGRESLSGALDRALRSPLYLLGGLLSGTVVTTGSEVLSKILLAWIRRNTGLLRSPSRPSPTPTAVTPPGTHTPAQGEFIAYGSPIVAVLILVVAVIFLFAVIIVLARGLLGRLRRPGDGAPEAPPPTAPDEGDGAPPDEAAPAAYVPSEDVDPADYPRPGEPIDQRVDRVRELPYSSIPPEPPEPPGWPSRILTWLGGFRGLLWGSVGGAVVGLALGMVYLPTVAVQVAIALGVAGAAVGDVVSR